MTIFHRITLNSGLSNDKEPIRKLIEHNTKHKKLPQPNIGSKDFDDFLYIFDTSESDPNWDKVSYLIKKYNLHTVTETVFDENEIINAEWLRIMTIYEHGYPQPEGNWVTQTPNYKDVCKKCGMYTQENSFHIKNEPVMKNNDFMGLLWTSAVFATNKVFDLLESNKITGYEKWPVVIHKTEKPSTTISQVYIPHIAKPGLRDQFLSKIKCLTCGTIKYYPHNNGIMHLTENTLDPNLDFQLTAEWFGSGHMAYRETIVSNKVAKLIIENKLKGVRFKVVELISNVN